MLLPYVTGCTAHDVTTWGCGCIRIIEWEESQSTLPLVHVLAGNFTYHCVVTLFSQMARVSGLCSAKGRVACVQPKGKRLVFSERI